jgi:predicted lipid carrier protein YhbT
MPAPNLPHLPRPLAFAVCPLPTLPLTAVLGWMVQRMTRAHPTLLQRMGKHADRRFLIDPTDFPFVLLLHPASGAISAHRRGKLPAYDARMAGPMSAFLAMMHGAEDGDALFFSRDLTIEGDTAAVLALRNAIDDAELDLSVELTAASGRFAGVTRRALARAEQMTGLTLHRIDGGDLL